MHHTLPVGQYDISRLTGYVNFKADRADVRKGEFAGRISHEAPIYQILSSIFHSFLNSASQTMIYLLLFFLFSGQEGSDRN